MKQLPYMYTRTRFGHSIFVELRDYDITKKELPDKIKIIFINKTTNQLHRNHKLRMHSRKHFYILYLKYSENVNDLNHIAASFFFIKVCW